MESDGDGIDDEASIFVRRRLLEVGPRTSNNRFQSWQFQLGVRGDIGESSWSYDAYLQTGQVTLAEEQLGNVSRNRFTQALLLDLSDPTGGTCADPSSNGATVPCSPINIFGEGNISAEGAAFLRTAVVSAVNFDQEIYSITVNGVLF